MLLHTPAYGASHSAELVPATARVTRTRSLALWVEGMAWSGRHSATMHPLGERRLGPARPGERGHHGRSLRGGSSEARGACATHTCKVCGTLPLEARARRVAPHTARWCPTEGGAQGAQVAMRGCCAQRTSVSEGRQAPRRRTEPLIGVARGATLIHTLPVPQRVGLCSQGKCTAPCHTCCAAASRSRRHDELSNPPALRARG